MSTRAKDGPVKEKRGKSPSNIRHTDPAQRRKSPHPPSIDHQKFSSTTSSNSSNVPNYLRPTISSRVENAKNLISATKKPSATSTDTTYKSTINRRRSLDNKPPPTSQLLKAHTSVEKNTRPTSTVVKAKTASALTKPLPEKVAKAFSKDVGKPHSLYSRPVKTIKKNITTSSSASNTNTTKKHKSTSTNASATKAPISTTDRHSANVEDAPKHEPLQEDLESSVTEPEEEEEEEETGSNPAEVVIVEDKEHVDIQPHEADQSEETEESEEEVKKLPDSSTVYEEQKTTPVSEEPNVAPVVDTEDTEPEEIHIDGSEIKDKEVEEEGKDENVNKNHHQQKESFESEPIVEADSEKKLKETEESPKEKGLEEKEKVDDEGNKGSKPEHDTQEVEVAEEVRPEVKEVRPEVKEVRPDVKEAKSEVNKVEPEVKEEKPEIKEVKPEVKEEKPAIKEVEPEIREVKTEEMHKLLVSKPQGNKKDNTAYNDVIEETASKLREQRRNKVKALVGAFETVISLEDPESETPRGN